MEEATSMFPQLPNLLRAKTEAIRRKKGLVLAYRLRSKTSVRHRHSTTDLRRVPDQTIADLRRSHSHRVLKSRGVPSGPTWTVKLSPSLATEALIQTPLQLAVSVVFAICSAGA